MTTQKIHEEVLDHITELYMMTEDARHKAELLPIQRYAAVAMGEQLVIAYARVHKQCYPVPMGSPAPVMDDVAPHMQVVTMTVTDLLAIASKAAKNSLANDLVHIVVDDNFITAHILQPHLEGRARQVHCSTSVFSK